MRIGIPYVDCERLPPATPVTRKTPSRPRSLLQLPEPESYQIKQNLFYKGFHNRSMLEIHEQSFVRDLSQNKVIQQGLCF